VRPLWPIAHGVGAVAILAGLLAVYAATLGGAW
jgi:hypothetical protein